MKSFFLLTGLLATVYPIASTLATINVALPIVNLGYATYQGIFDTTLNQSQFLGIRYANPPLGMCLFGFSTLSTLTEFLFLFIRVRDCLILTITTRISPFRCTQISSDSSRYSTSHGISSTMYASWPRTGCYFLFSRNFRCRRRPYKRHYASGAGPSAKTERGEQ
jgi:hypothetical protein